MATLPKRRQRISADASVVGPAVEVTVGDELGLVLGLMDSSVLSSIPGPGLMDAIDDGLGPTEVVGTWDGTLVGLRDGTVVGVLEGLEDGNEVGVNDGTLLLVGMSDGIDEGIVLGSLLSVGVLVGSTVLVGVVDGWAETLGVDDGRTEGPVDNVGELLGASDGRVDGITVSPSETPAPNWMGGLGTDVGVAVVVGDEETDGAVGRNERDGKAVGIVSVGESVRVGDDERVGIGTTVGVLETDGTPEGVALSIRVGLAG